MRRIGQYETASQVAGKPRDGRKIICAYIATNEAPFRASEFSANRTSRIKSAADPTSAKSYLLPSRRKISSATK